MTIYEKVKALRTKLGYTQEQFSAILGSNQATISMMENGYRKPSYDLTQRLQRLAKKSKIKIAFI